MQSPELLLSKLNRALRELRGAAYVLNNPDVDAQMVPIMRRLALAEIMHARWLIAVGGTQSAGKTTLVRTLYGVDNKWLPPNEGQGETLPILIEESDQHAAPQGYARMLVPDARAPHQFISDDVLMAQPDFVAACRGQNAAVLLPILRVPRRYFQHDGQALLLLPGYELRTPVNATWQDLMRQALVGAAGCVIVTDPSRLASGETQDIVQDMLSNELRTIAPLVVIAKTENLAKEAVKLGQLRQTALEAFALKGEHAAARVFCAGVDVPDVHANYVDTWLPALGAALRDMSLSGAASRQVQLSKLEQMLTNDLGAVLRELETEGQLLAAQSRGGTGAHATVKNCLAAFDEARNSLRVRHEAMVGKFTSTHYQAAWQDMETRLINDHEGVKHKILQTFDTVTETQRKLKQNVMGAWAAPGPLLAQYTAGLGELTARAAGPKMGRHAMPDDAPPLQRLGYVNDKQAAVPARFTEVKVQGNLHALMRSRAGDDNVVVSDNDLDVTARLLPVMALEFTRIASAMPALVHVSPTTLADMPEGDVNAALTTMHQQFSEFSGISRDILKGIAAIMAVDVVSDGHADIINALLSSIGIGAGPAVAGLTVGAAVAGVVAIGYLAHTAIQGVRHHDGRVSTLASSMLQSARDRHDAHFAEHYDRLMDIVRDQLNQGLRRRYALDRRLMDEDRLQKALADVRVFRQDLLSHLAQSGQTLALFDQRAA
jgi:hypothetical protein